MRRCWTLVPAEAGALYALRQAENRAGQLRTALTSNRVIGAATGILMQKHLLANAQAGIPAADQDQPTHQPQVARPVRAGRGDRDHSRVRRAY